jgi:hypothetical protein
MSSDNVAHFAFLALSHTNVILNKITVVSNTKYLLQEIAFVLKTYDIGSIDI